MIYIFAVTILYGLLPFLLIVFDKRVRNIESFYPFIFVVFIASLYEFIFSMIVKVNVENWFFVYGILAFIGIHYFFYNLLHKKFKSFFIVSIFIFVAFSILAFIYRISFDYLTISAFFKVNQTIIILIFSILWFRRMFEELETDDLLKNSNFYFISGLIIYYCGSVFLYLLANYIYASDKSNFQYYWLLNIILNLILRTLIIIGIWKARLK